MVVLSKERKYSTQADIFSFGILLWYVSILFITNNISHTKQSQIYPQRHLKKKYGVSSHFICREVTLHQIVDLKIDMDDVKSLCQFEKSRKKGLSDSHPISALDHNRPVQSIFRWCTAKENFSRLSASQLIDKIGQLKNYRAIQQQQQEKQQQPEKQEK